ncbi:CAP domain-containing protein [Microbulbifer sp. GL-2]|uniref:CAP domain-containing protein n=1 Tax=Microbulbifer sp. GL-2 TaxID=2591606 RepID=UPI0011630422|nr:CAP domain-containing protein [Microbulbifer sp. GL-2]BBM00178.1 hypothetical protein GL2_02520 [Microbulbifer sp. GL-2]
MKTRWLKIATLSLSILLLISCGGSGSSDDSDKQNGSAPDISDPIDGNNEGENNEGENNEGENNEGENNVDNPPYEGEVLVHNFTLSEKRALLDAHNEYRAKCANGEAGLNSPVNAANMVKVSWDPALEEMARERAQACWFGHFGGPEAIRNAYNSVRHLTSFNSEGLAATKYASENVALYPGNPPATNYGSDTWVAAVREWYLESGSYDWDTNGCHGEYCGHLGQVCEANTRYIGCAVANCPSIGGRDSSDYNDGALQLVCTYWPARDIGQLPFENGYGYPWCTGCAQKDMNQCFNNMCVGGKSTEYEANGGTNDDIDQCTDGLGREEPLCRKNDDSTPPHQ